ncbi:MAG: helix-turn-helix transcriptional regulator [Pirellulaceae bacterium]
MSFSINIPASRILDSSHDDHEFDVAAGNPQFLGEVRDKIRGRALGILFQYLRRDRAMTIEQLAEQIGIAQEEIWALERDPHFHPQPRTIQRLAAYFELSEQKLSELADLKPASSLEVQAAAVRFAMDTSKAIDLHADERNALNQFVKHLCQ